MKTNIFISAIRYHSINSTSLSFRQPGYLLYTTGHFNKIKTLNPFFNDLNNIQTEKKYDKVIPSKNQLSDLKFPAHLMLPFDELKRCPIKKLPIPSSQEWLVKDDPRRCSIQLFLPTTLDDPEYLQKELLWCYRKILRESSRFIDLRARHYFLERAKERFRAYQGFSLTSKVFSKRVEARKISRKIAQANQYNGSKFLSALELAYGRKGKLRWLLLQPYLPPLHLFAQKYKEGIPNEIELHPFILALARHQGLKILPHIDESIKHSPVRIFNSYRRHYKKLIEQILPPLPLHIVKELEERADTQYHIQRAVYYPLDPFPCPGEYVPASELKASYRPTPPSMAKLRRLARSYQKLLLEIPIQKSGPNYFSPEDHSKEKISFKLSKWAGSRAPPEISTLDQLSFGEGIYYIQKYLK